MPPIGRETVQFASYGRPWLIVVKGPRGMAFDRWLVRRTGFSLVSLQYAMAGGNAYTPTLLLTTLGAKSGELREAALPYLERDGEYVVVGSKGGGQKDPGWVHNLRVDPRCWLVVRRRRVTATARVADEAEWRELFPWVVQHKPNVARYQQRADTFGRRIPFVILTPRAKSNR
jgi:deazaflavin-dependent oxidoreductase (nitroreductase family)